MNKFEDKEITNCTMKLDGSCVIETDKGKFYICKDKTGKDAPWVLKTYNSVSNLYE